MKARWRILANGLGFKDMKLCAKTIQVCCALHNFILKHRTDQSQDPADMDDYMAELEQANDDLMNYNEEPERNARGRIIRVRTAMKIVDRYYR